MVQHQKILNAFKKNMNIIWMQYTRNNKRGLFNLTSMTTL